MSNEIQTAQAAIRAWDGACPSGVEEYMDETKEAAFQTSIAAIRALTAAAPAEPAQADADAYTQTIGELLSKGFKVTIEPADSEPAGEAVAWEDRGTVPDGYLRTPPAEPAPFDGLYGQTIGELLSKGFKVTIEPAGEASPVALSEGERSPSYDALLIIAQSVCGALERAGITDCDDPGEAIDVLREGYEKRLTAQPAAGVKVTEAMKERACRAMSACLLPASWVRPSDQAMKAMHVALTAALTGEGK